MAADAHDGELRSVFVYGTLQTGFRNNERVVRGRANSVSPARLHGACVFHFPGAGFPGMWRSADDQAQESVTGQLLTFTPAAWPGVLVDLDLLESFFGPGHASNEYAREVVHVAVGGSPVLVPAWTYFCLLDRVQYGAQLVAHGDWAEYMAREGLADAGDDWSDVLRRAAAAGGGALTS